MLPKSNMRLRARLYGIQAIVFNNYKAMDASGPYMYFITAVSAPSMRSMANKSYGAAPLRSNAEQGTIIKLYLFS
jgi:hypothetical protein